MQRHLARLWLFRVVGTYVLFSLAWILGSDRLLVLLIQDIHVLTRLQTIKGLAFGSISAGLLYVIVSRMIKQLKRSEEEVRKANLELEKRVADRTHQLEAINKDLEAFARSASHDLRAPIRSIRSFLDIFMQEHSAVLDSEASASLARIHRAADRMSELLEQMMALARVSGAELRRESVDMSAMAHEIAEGMRGQDRDRDIEVVVQDGLVVSADPALLQAVMENLLSNAFKFTSKHKKARIEVGSTVVGGERVFYVKDDGVGFDMHNADKLFQPFMRLHTRSEFEGSGIGLSTVQRIIERHGGRIWVEAAVDRGAAFLFTFGPDRFADRKC